MNNLILHRSYKNVCMWNRLAAIWMLLNCNYKNEWNMRVIIYSIVYSQIYTRSHCCCILVNWISNIWPNIYLFFQPNTHKQKYAMSRKSRKQKWKCRQTNEHSTKSALDTHKCCCACSSEWYMVFNLFIFTFLFLLRDTKTLASTAHWRTRHTNNNK